MPSAPPMNPLTTSYFICWAFFDACMGSANETIGTTILEVGAAFGMHPELLRLIRLMQDSRMGFYIHRGREGDVSVLEDVVTTAVYAPSFPPAIGAGRTRTGTAAFSRRQCSGVRNMSSSRRHTSWSIRTSPIGWRISGVRSPPRRASAPTTTT